MTAIYRNLEASSRQVLLLRVRLADCLIWERSVVMTEAESE